MYILQLSTEMSNLTVQYEALRTKHQLIVTNFKQELGSLDTSLKESKHICEERTELINNLESSKAELVSYMKF